jgi:hypothetical protein
MFAIAFFGAGIGAARSQEAVLPVACEFDGGLAFASSADRTMTCQNNHCTNWRTTATERPAENIVVGTFTDGSRWLRVAVGAGGGASAVFANAERQPTTLPIAGRCRLVQR